MLRSSGNAVLLITPKSKVQKKGEEWGEEEEEQETMAGAFWDTHRVRGQVLGQVEEGV